jgi:hypothetical protein
METETNNAAVVRRRPRAVRCCSHCGEEGHTIRNCNDDRIRELEVECARRIQHYTEDQFTQFLNTEFETEPTLIRALAIKKCRATTKTSKVEVVRAVSVYIRRTYVYGARDIYDAFNGHSAFSNDNGFSEREREEVTDAMVQSMAYALRREMLIFTMANILENFIRDKPNINNNKINIISTVKNDENLDIHQSCECSICYEERKVSDFTKFNCNHEFCKDCVINTIKSRRNANNICCALCRTEVKSVESKTNEVKAELDEYIE